MKKKIEDLCNGLSNYLDIPLLPVKFDKIGEEDSRLLIKENSVVINEKFKDDFVECAKCITHEYRHAWQLFYVYENNDQIAKMWKEDLTGYKKPTATSEYFLKTIEVDAFAFTKYYLKRFLNMNVTNNIQGLDVILDKYIKDYRGIIELVYE